MKIIKSLVTSIFLFMIFFGMIGAAFQYFATQSKQLKLTVDNQKEAIQSLTMQLSDENQLRQNAETKLAAVSQENNTLRNQSKQQNAKIKKGKNQYKRLAKQYTTLQDSTDFFRQANFATQKQYKTLTQNYEVLAINLEETAKSFDKVLAKNVLLESEVIGLTDSVTILAVALDQVEEINQERRTAELARFMNISLGGGISLLLLFLLMKKINGIRFRYKFI